MQAGVSGAGKNGKEGTADAAAGAAAGGAPMHSQPPAQISPGGYGGYHGSYHGPAMPPGAHYPQPGAYPGMGPYPPGPWPGYNPYHPSPEYHAAMMGGPGMPPQPPGQAAVPHMHAPGAGPHLDRQTSYASSGAGGGASLNTSTAAMTGITKMSWVDYQRCEPEYIMHCDI